jgi:hypothetical protein
MPVHDGSGSNHDERLPPPTPERSQGNPEQLVQGSQSSARPLRVQSQQLPTESQVFEDEVLAGAKRADDPPEEMPERHNHGKNRIGTIRIQVCAKSFILQMYDVLARHNLPYSFLVFSVFPAMHSHIPEEERASTDCARRSLIAGVRDSKQGTSFMPALPR